MNVVCQGLIASRLTPTGERISNVGVSLLAIGVFEFGK